jgi:hypothetical protein
MKSAKQRRDPRALVQPALWFCACNLLAAALSAQCTNPTPVLTNQTVSSGTATYSDNNALTTNATINGSASITLFAGNCIDLVAGFHAKATDLGAAPMTFHALVSSGPPSITSLFPNSGAVGTSVTISGSNFGPNQGTSTVKFNGVTASVAAWSNTSITSIVPSGATTGNVLVTVVGVQSNGVGFTVPETISQPSQPSGPAVGQLSTPYSFSSSGSVSSLGHSLQYEFLWGDGTNSGWLAVGTTSASHTWGATGTYSITVIARCATDTAITSQPSSSLAVSISTTLPTPSLTITSTHSGNFTQADTGDTYTLTVSNAPGAGSTNGTAVMVTEFIPAGFVPTNIAGTGWTCAQPAGPCSRADVLAGGAAYPPIILTVSVAPNAPATTTNSVGVSGGGSPSNFSSDATTINVLARYSNPIAFTVPASVVAGVPATFSVTHTSDNGPSDIDSGQIKIDNCYLQWDSAGNVRLFGGSNGYVDATGTLGQNSVLWAGNCSINLLNSSLSTPANNPKALVLSLNITFSAQDFLTSPYTEFVGQHEVYAWGTSAGGLSTGQTDLGALVVSQGRDFTLSVTPGGGNSITVPNGGSAVLYVTTTGLSGFNGTITVFVTHASGSTCLNSTLASFPMSANAQTSFSVQNLGCPNGATAQFNVTGQTNWGAPNQLQRYGSASATMVAGTTGDFTVTVNSPSNPTLSPAGSVSYPVTVQSINGQSGSVNLSASGLPTGVSPQLSPATLSLSANGVAYSTLTLIGSASMPGGSFPITVRASIGSLQRTASFTMGTQVTTFQVTSVTGGAIVHNTGQEVQVTHTVPANNAPTFTTCDTADPNVACRVISTAPGTVTVGLTAGVGAPHGTRALRLNAGAAVAMGAVTEQGGAGLPTITVPAGGHGEGETTVPEEPCYIDGPCAFAIVVGSEPWIQGFGLGNSVHIAADPPPFTLPGSYQYWVDVCGGFLGTDDDNDYDCAIGPGVVNVTPIPPPPPCGSSQIELSTSAPTLSLARRPLCPAPPTLSVSVNGNAIESGATVSVSPSDPPLHITANLLNASGTVTWRLHATYKEDCTGRQPKECDPKKTSSPDEIYPFGPPASYSAGEPWSYTVSTGGTVTILWSLNSGPVDSSFSFYVNGTNSNPNHTDLMAYIGNDPWYIPYQAGQESTYRQFDQNHDSGNWRPFFGEPDGYGVLQVDSSTDFKLTLNLLYNWKDNVDRAKVDIQRQANIAAQRWNSQYVAWQNYLAANPTSTQGLPRDLYCGGFPTGWWCTYDPPLPAHYCRFTAQDPPPAGAHHFRDAIALKRYNGITTPYGFHADFITFVSSGPSPGWTIYNTNINGQDYVSRVCNQTP